MARSVGLAKGELKDFEILEEMDEFRSMTELNDQLRVFLR